VSDRQPWERQHKEPRPAFAAFALYRDLPTETRSIDAAYRAAKRGKGAKRASGRWLKWSSTWGWVERSAAYDSHIDGQKRAAFAAEVVEMSRQHARGLQATRQTLLAPVRIALDAMNDPAALERMKTLTATAEGLRSVLHDARLAAVALPAIVQAERLVAGLDTQTVRVHEQPDTRFADAILASPAATDAAIALLDEVAKATENEDAT
jgi:hypothetical protein